MALTRIMLDGGGLLVRFNRTVFRPGGVAGFAHVYDMSDAGVAEGQRVAVSAGSNPEVCRIRRADGGVLRRACEERHASEARRSPERLTREELAALGMSVTPMRRAGYGPDLPDAGPGAAVPRRP